MPPPIPARSALVIRLVFAVLLALAAGCSRADTRPEPIHDTGGSVLERAMEIAGMRGPFPIRGYCSSACTMYLGYPGTCVYPGATFGFHAVARDYTGLAKPLYENHLPPCLRDWYRGHAADDDRVVRRSGRWLIRRGWARAC
jgi:hypothetical protein